MHLLIFASLSYGDDDGDDDDDDDDGLPWNVKRSNWCMRTHTCAPPRD